MKSTGKFGALQSQRPTPLNIGDKLAQHENQLFKYREEKRKIDVLKQQALDKKEAKKQQALSRITALKLQDTGSKGYNDLAMDVIIQAQKEMGELARKTTDSSLSYEEQSRAKLKLESLRTVPDKLYATTKALTDEYNNYMQMVTVGDKKGKKWHRNLEYEKRFEGGYDAIRMGIDDDYNVVTIFGQGTEDINGDGVVNREDVETMESLRDPSQRPKFIPIFDREDALAEIKKRSATRKETKEIGGYKTKVTVTPTVSAHDEAIDTYYEADGETPNQNLISELEQIGGDINNPAHVASVIADFEADVKAQTSTEESITTDQSAIIARERLNLSKEKEDKNQQEADWYRSVVDKASVGDPDAIGLLNTKNRKVTFAGTTMTIKNIAKDGTPSYEKIDMNEPESIGRLMTLFAPKSDPDENLSRYKRGRTAGDITPSTKEFDETDVTRMTSALNNADGINGDDKEYLAYVNKKYPEGSKDLKTKRGDGNIIIHIPTGKEYKLSDKKEARELNILIASGGKVPKTGAPVKKKTPISQ